jgi:predicted RNA-binding protein with PUA-like domain
MSPAKKGAAVTRAKAKAKTSAVKTSAVKTSAVKTSAVKTSAEPVPGGVGPFGWAIAPRAPGEVRHWLVKSEPDVFSFDDLLAAPDRTTCWDGVRNYTARNLMLHGMRVGDLVLFYHSNAAPSGVAGIAEVVREAYPDPTQFDPRSEYFDAAARREAPAWVMVDVRAVEKLRQVVTLEAMRADPALEGLETVRKGSRLSVHPVSAGHFARIAGR